MKINVLAQCKQNHTLSKEDCRSIVSLMLNGLSLQEAMHILKDKRNGKIFMEIENKLQQGETLSTFFYLYLEKNYSSYFCGFIQYMPFLESLSTSIDIIDAEESNRVEIMKGMLYPTLLLVGMLVGIWIFNETILPNMIKLMSGFSLDAQSYVILQKGMKATSFILMTGAVTSVCIVLIALQKKYIISTYCFISTIFSNSILSQYASQQFAQFFLECQKRNIATKKALEILSSLKEKPLVSYIAKSMNEHLIHGDSLQEAMKTTHVEPALLRFFTVALYASDCEGMLEGYLEMVKIRKQNAIRKYSRNVQVFSYSMIGIVLIFVYRILMMPMTMLQNI